MKIPFYIILACLFLPNVVFAGISSEYPGPRKIIQNFALNYDYNQYKSQDFRSYRFIKSPDGWIVQPEFYSGNTVPEIKLWNDKSGFALSKNINADTSSVNILEFMDRTDLYYYSVYPFYGYTGWRQDLIKAIADIDKQDLSDHELFSLGTAYSLEASDILWSHSMYSDTSMSHGPDANQKEIARYTLLGKKAINVYRELEKRNPDYLTRVGRIGVKLANEIISKYYELRLFGFDRQADKYYRQNVTKNLYNSFWEQYALSLLENLENGAVLFTNGDNDTYPLLWLQSKGIRPDVRVINLSLLNDPRYADLLNISQEEQQKLFTYHNSELTALNHKTILLENKPVYPDLVNLDFLEVEIRNGLALPEEILTATSSRYYIDFINSEGLADTLHINLSREGKVLSLMEIFVLDILNKNLGKKKIYFVKALHRTFSQMLEEEQINDKGLTLGTEVPERGTVKLNSHVFDTVSINNFLLNRGFDPKPELYSQKIIYDLVMEAEFFSIYFNQGNLNVLARKTSNFITRFPPEKAGISYYYLVALYQLGRSGFPADSVQQLQNKFFTFLESEIHRIDVSDDNPQYFKVLNYYSSVLQSAANTRMYNYYPGSEERISSLIRAIESKLPDRQVLEIR